MKPRQTLISVALLAALWPCAAAAHRHEPTEVVSSFVRNWNQGDAGVMAGLFETDADYFQPFGSYARGREAIHALLRKTPFAELGTLELVKSKPTRMRFLNPCLAFVEWEARLSNAGTVRARLLLVAIVVPGVSAAGDSQEWSFSAFRLVSIPIEAAGK